MIDEWLIKAYWNPRKESPRNCAQRTVRCLSLLNPIDHAFTNWYDSGGTPTPKEALLRKIEISEKNILPIIKSGCYRKDVGNEVMEDLGYFFVLWNGDVGGCDIILEVQCGAYCEWTAPMTNSCILKLQFENLRLANLLTLDVVRKLIDAIVNSWKPDIVWVDSGNMGLATYPSKYRGTWVGWVSYFTDKLGEIPQLPAFCRIERVEEGTLVVVNGEKPLNPVNPLHVKQIRRLGDILRDAGILSSLKKR